VARGRSDFFGLIVSDIGNPFVPEVVKGFEAAALEKEFDLLLFNTNYDPGRTEAAVRRMIENKVRGVAVMTSEWGSSLAQDLATHQVAVVFLDLGPVGKYTSNIHVDYSRGIYQAIDHLRGLGHRDFCFIAGPQALRSAVTRRRAFVDALNQWNLPSHLTLEGNHKVDGGMRAVQTLLAHHPLPTAILCSNDLTALGALKALAEAGVSVPEDVSVVGFDDINFAQFAHPALTTVNLSRERLGQLAFDALGKILRSKSREGEEYIVETQLVVRESTALANISAANAPDSRAGEAPRKQATAQAVTGTVARPPG
jgi:DNA-binding LacI/PurR family transcriptional regulator